MENLERRMEKGLVGEVESRSRERETTQHNRTETELNSEIFGL